MTDEDFKALVMAEGVVPAAVPTVRLLYDASGEAGIISVGNFVRGEKERSPHWWPNTFEKDSVDTALVEAACGAKPTLAARSKLLKAAGPVLYEEFLRDWSASPSTLAPGKNPKTSGGDSGEKKKAPRDVGNNPFHKSQWNISKQGALVRTLGLDKANAIAKSVGSHVGATSPNADY